MKRLLAALGIVFSASCISRAVSVGPAQIVTIDSTAYNAGTAPFTPVGGVYSDTLPPVSSTTTAAARMTSRRAIHVNLRDSSGNEIGTPSNPLAIVSTATFNINGSTVQAFVLGTTTITYNGVSQPVFIVQVPTVTFNGASQPVNTTNVSTVSISGVPQVFASSTGVNSSTVAATIINQPTIANTGFNVNNLPSVTTVTFNGSAQPVSQSGSWGSTVTVVNVTTTTINGNVSVQPVSGTTWTVTGSTVNIGQYPPPFLLSDTVSNPTTTASAAMVYGWNGNNWDRAKTGGDNADALATSGVGHLQVIGHLTGYNGTSWDRLRSSISNGLQVDVTRVQGNSAVSYSTAQTTNVLSSTFNVTNISVSTPVAGIASQTVRVFRLIVTVDAGTTITFKNGTTSFGDQYPLLANGSIVLDLTNEPWYVTGSSNSFVINQTGTANISYAVWFTQS